MAYDTSIRCPIQRTMALVADKWKVLIVDNLRDGRRLRFGEMHRALEGVTPRVLSRQLRELEHDGLISRTNYGSVPPRVEYALTPLRSTLLPIFNALNDWAIAHAEDVFANHLRSQEAAENKVAI